MEDEMDIQILVAYATKYGATAGIAEKIGQVLRQAGLLTDVLPVDRVSDLTPYEAVVLGSAVYIGKVLAVVVSCFLRVVIGTIRDRLFL
jgi:menaquinone-dependent protoporphyrinogen IX oxidase